MEKCWDANTGCNQFLTWRGAGQLYHYRAVIAEMMSDLISRPPTLSIRHLSSSRLDVCYDEIPKRARWLTLERDLVIRSTRNVRDPPKKLDGCQIGKLGGRLPWRDRPGANFSHHDTISGRFIKSPVELNGSRLGYNFKNNFPNCKCGHNKADGTDLSRHHNSSCPIVNLLKLKARDLSYGNCQFDPGARLIPPDTMYGILESITADYPIHTYNLWSTPFRFYYDNFNTCAVDLPLMMGVGVMATPGLIKGARGRFVKEGTWCTLRGMGKSPQEGGGRQSLTQLEKNIVDTGTLYLTVVSAWSHHHLRYAQRLLDPMDVARLNTPSGWSGCCEDDAPDPVHIYIRVIYPGTHLLGPPRDSPQDGWHRSPSLLFSGSVEEVVVRKLRPNNRGTDRVAGRDFPAATRPSVNRTRDCLTSLIEDFYTNRRIFSRKIFRTSRRHPIQMPPRRLSGTAHHHTELRLYTAGRFLPGILISAYTHSNLTPHWTIPPLGPGGDFGDDSHRNIQTGVIYRTGPADSIANVIYRGLEGVNIPHNSAPPGSDRGNKTLEKFPTNLCSKKHLILIWTRAPSGFHTTSSTDRSGTKERDEDERGRLAGTILDGDTKSVIGAQHLREGPSETSCTERTIIDSRVSTRKNKTIRCCSFYCDPLNCCRWVTNRRTLRLIPEEWDLDRRLWARCVGWILAGLNGSTRPEGNTKNKN
ncbi:hypothetical protein GEV33_007581 [Tenebrio molitor]|uniref:Uncharacterized protein n=1 Tax=Tenebrio molitor TaxID=7067 RepID=A0A8J6HKD1_TENMO|nr:hypothetical protein GEV33_007581 [Tenebrio molitor]